MSLFQCENCGCCENTALAGHSIKGMSDIFDWTGIEYREGTHLCSACAPKKHSDGTPSGYGVWHGEFDRVFLPKGEFHTNKVGNLEHTETGSTDFRKFEINEDGTEKGRCKCGRARERKLYTNTCIGCGLEIGPSQSVIINSDSIALPKIKGDSHVVKTTPPAIKVTVSPSTTLNIKQQVEMAKTESRRLDRLGSLAQEFGGRAYFIHESVDVMIPKENMEAFMAKAKELKLI